MHITPNLISPFLPHTTWTGPRGIGSLAPYEIVDLSPAGLDLDNCGAPALRRPDLFVEFPISYVYQINWALDAAAPQYFLDERRPVSSRGDFILDRVDGIPVTGVRIRFVWPSGKFSANVRIPTANYFGQGDSMAQFLDGVPIPAGQWIGIEVEIDANTAANIFTMSFDGRMRYYLKSTN